MTFNIFNKLFFRQEDKAPQEVENAFRRVFEDSSSVEWHATSDHNYEVIFYYNDREHIAQFTRTGELVNHHVNLKADELPQVVAKQAYSRGEIMSAIAIYELLEIATFEIIFRDSEKIRYVMDLLPSGEILSLQMM